MTIVPHLGAACSCGRPISIPCPTVADIPVAQRQMVGWGLDARGRVKCPDCLAASSPDTPRQRTDLFEEVQ